jgi:serine/threonine-protein kinase
MTDEPRVRQLLDEIFDSERTPEEVCSDCPELLPEVRRRWQRIRLVDAELDALFPTPAPGPGTDTQAPWRLGARLPEVPGYDVEGVLGRGGVGVVYKARHLRLKRPVALKMLLVGACATPAERERFLREAEAVAGLRHPNIVQVHDVGEHEGRPYFTMEYVEGGSLAQKLAGAPQPAREATALVATLAEAVQVAHQGGIVHRDLKPGNILLTADGTPKVTDFGLARRLEGSAGLTQSGTPVGTPSYMAPEQAQGKSRAAGPAADVYALGAILYELLTGRPPFRGETAAETVLQVLFEEPVPPSRLNAKVPRDLETICLKCLHKEPHRRYATAAAMAEDLRRFQRGEPIVARRAGALERVGKWVRRRPAQAATLATSLLLAAALVGVSLWLVGQRAHERDAVEAELKEAAWLRDDARWAEARAALDRAEGRLGWGAPGDLRARLAQARRDLELAVRLDAIRLRRVTRGELTFYKGQADREYAEAFREAGLGQASDEPSAVAVRINASAVREALVAAVHDWAVCAGDREERGWLLEVARHADPDAGGWRERALDPAAWEDSQALAELARTAPAATESVSLLQALGERLRAAGGDATPLLKLVQKERPADFWANLILGNAMLQGAPRDAAGYYRAALASRPGAAVGYCAVGDALRLQKWPDQAIEYYEKALQLDPDYARAYSNVGDALQDQGRPDEAAGYYEKALRLDPDYAWAHHNLANVLRGNGRLGDAYAHYQQALRVDPNNFAVQNGARSVLVRQGRGEEARLAWRKALEADPPEHDAWFGYAELCLFLGQDEEYRRARRALLDRFGTTTDPGIAERVGRAVLLLPASEDELQQAVALADRAVAAKGAVQAWVYRYFLFAKGLAEYRRGRLDSAIAMMRGEAAKVMGPAPRLVVAMAQHRQGRKEEARKTLAAAVRAYDWSAAEADSRDPWIIHILRREAEALIRTDLPAFLAGTYRPGDNDERLALAEACEFRGLHAAAARLYADAFATGPVQTEDLTAGWRYRAARSAAQAGCGLGLDGTGLGEAERTRWRKQACGWLRADLAAWVGKLDGGSATESAAVRKVLTRWRADPDLAGVREPGALERLSADERDEWLALWKEVAAALDRAGEAK